MKILFVTLTLIATGWSAASMPADADPIAVTLSLVSSEVRVGQHPGFVVVVKATRAVKVLRFKERSDLRHNYASITIKRNGNTVNDIPQMISDPGPTSESDYLQLRTGEQYSFEHDGRPQDLTALRPGTYTATVKVWPDWDAEPVYSNVVTFRVK